MNDEQFEQELQFLSTLASPPLIEQIRARDTAQREEIAELRAALATQPPEFRWTCINHWFLSLDPNRQESLLENKWALASAAFDAGQSTEDAVRGAEHDQ